MFDKAIFVSKYKIVLIFTHRSPFTLHNSEGKVLEMYDEFMAPPGFKTVSEYERRKVAADEKTVEIILDKVA